MGCRVINKQLLGLATFLVVIVAWWGYADLVVENFNGDGVEIFAPAESFRTHWLPHWDLEAEPRFGLPVAAPLWSYHLLMFPWIVLLGPCEAAVRLPLLGFLALLCVTLGSLWSSPSMKAVPRWLLWYLGGVVLWATVLFMRYGGYDRTTLPTTEGAPFLWITALLLWQVHCLKTRRGWLFVVLALIGVTTRYLAGLLSFLLLGAAWVVMLEARPWVRRQAVRLIAGIAVIAGGVIAIGCFQKSLHAWRLQLAAEFSESMFLWPPSLGSWLRFIRQWIILSGGVSVLGLVWLRRLPPIGRVVGLTAVVYGALLSLLTMDRTFHEQVILAVLTMATGGYWLLQVAPRRQAVIGWAATATLAGLIAAAAIPDPQVARHANRNLGSQTCMLFADDETAMRHARIADDLFERGLMGARIDYSAWTHYAAVTMRPTRHYLYYVSDTPDPPLPGAILLMATPEGSHCFAASPAAAQALRAWNPPQRRRLSWLDDRG